MRTGPLGAGRLTGFTLLETLIALAIVALLAAVALPNMARRLDTAFADADLQQLGSSAQGLPARVATLGIDLVLDQKALALALPDGNPPIDIPPGWTATVETAARFWHSTACAAGSVLFTQASTGQRWRITVARATCAIGVTEVA
ncbi:MAG: prepilin-type N-terminal cleavage/methylation domain-containing protein [Rubrivivax sp.]